MSTTVFILRLDVMLANFFVLFCFIAEELTPRRQRDDGNGKELRMLCKNLLVACVIATFNVIFFLSTSVSASVAFIANDRHAMMLKCQGNSKNRWKIQQFANAACFIFITNL